MPYKDDNQYDLLVVDDTSQNLTVLTMMLKGEGYQVRSAMNGQVALKAVQKTTPDLILLDIMMPDMSGYEVCQKLKANPLTQDIPIIFVSVKTEVFDKVKAFEFGAVDYITKPFQTQEVLARIRLHLTIRTLQQQLEQQNARFKGLADATFEGIIFHDQGIIVEVNRTLENISGYLRDELIGQHIFCLIDQESQNAFAHCVDADYKGPYEVRGIKKDGTLTFLEVQGKCVEYQGQPLNVLALRDIIWRKQLEQENISLKASLSPRDHFGKLVGKSALMQKLYERMMQAAASEETVIIYGETGTGKELAARTIFELSHHHTRDFVAVNCGATPDQLFEAQFFGYRKGAFTGANQNTPGYFDLAQGGTLFLDEVGELSPAMQAKLLRVLQDGEYRPVGSRVNRMADVRIIAATNKELRKMVQEGKIREDFFHRLHVIALDMPPLRWHKGDIPLLLTHFLQQRTPADSLLPTIPTHVMERLMAYDWPGNVRELFNELRRYLTTGELEFTEKQIRSSYTGPALTIHPSERPFAEIVEEVEKQLLARVLAQYRGNRTKTAEVLKIPLRSLHRKIKKYQL